jgi:hypothetical protein
LHFGIAAVELTVPALFEFTHLGETQSAQTRHASVIELAKNAQT